MVTAPPATSLSRLNSGDRAMATFLRAARALRM